MNVPGKHQKLGAESVIKSNVVAGIILWVLNPSCSREESPHFFTCHITDIDMDFRGPGTLGYNSGSRVDNLCCSPIDDGPGYVKGLVWIDFALYTIRRLITIAVT